MSTFTFQGTPYSIVKIDDLNWAVRETVIAQRGKSAGEDRAINHSYHATLEQALGALSRRVVDAEIHADIDQYITRLREVTHMLQEATT